MSGSRIKTLDELLEEKRSAKKHPADIASPPGNKRARVEDRKATSQTEEEDRLRQRALSKLHLEPDTASAHHDEDEELEEGEVRVHESAPAASRSEANQPAPACVVAVEMDDDDAALNKIQGESVAEAVVDIVSTAPPIVVSDTDSVVVAEESLPDAECSTVEARVMTDDQLSDHSSPIPPGDDSFVEEVEEIVEIYYPAMSGCRFEEAETIPRHAH